MIKEAEVCWGSASCIYDTTDPAIMQERTMRMMIGDWLINSITVKGLDCLDKYRRYYAYYRPAQRICVHDGPTLIKIILELINPDARVSARDMKDKLRTVDLSQFKGDVEEMQPHGGFACSDHLRRGRPP